MAANNTRVDNFPFLADRDLDHHITSNVGRFGQLRIIWGGTIDRVTANHAFTAPHNRWRWRFGSWLRWWWWWWRRRRRSSSAHNAANYAANYAADHAAFDAAFN